MAEKDFLLSANITATATGLIWIYRIVDGMNIIPEKLETVPSKLKHCYAWEFELFSVLLIFHFIFFLGGLIIHGVPWFLLFKKEGIPLMLLSYCRVPSLTWLRFLENQVISLGIRSTLPAGVIGLTPPVEEMFWVHPFLFLQVISPEENHTTCNWHFSSNISSVHIWSEQILLLMIPWYPSILSFLWFFIDETFRFGSLKVEFHCTCLEK